MESKAFGISTEEGLYEEKQRSIRHAECLLGEICNLFLRILIRWWTIAKVSSAMNAAE